MVRTVKYSHMITTSVFLTKINGKHKVDKVEYKVSAMLQDGCPVSTCLDMDENFYCCFNVFLNPVEHH